MNKSEFVLESLLRMLTYSLFNPSILFTNTLTNISHPILLAYLSHVREFFSFIIQILIKPPKDNKIFTSTYQYDKSYISNLHQTIYILHFLVEREL